MNIETNKKSIASSIKYVVQLLYFLPLCGNVAYLPQINYPFKGEFC